MKRIPRAVQLFLTSALSVVLVAPFAMPAIAFADSRNAGLIDGVWFSSNEPIEDAQDTLYAGVLNQSGGTISGTVSFAADNLLIGTTTFSAPSDQIIRVSISHSFKAGQHAISARIASLDDNGQVIYTQLPERILVVDPKPTPPPAAAGSSTGSGSGGGYSSGGSSGSSSGSSGTILSISSSTSATSTLRTTATVVNAFGGSVTSATAPIIKSITASRDAILGHTVSTTPQTSALDVITPSKNLFDVTVDIAGQATHHSVWDTLRAFLLSLLDWFLYCIIPIVAVILLFIGFRFLSRRHAH